MFGTSLAMQLRGAYLSMHRTFQAHFARFGVTADQFVVLSLLAADDGLIQRELVRRTCSDANTITALLRLLERDGLVQRERHENDGRARCVFLTEQGRRLQRRLGRSSDRLHRELEAAVAPDELAVLLRSLAQIAVTMGQMRQTATANPRKENKS
jgi:MarR family transcriptional regulator for hemolysin